MKPKPKLVLVIDDNADDLQLYSVVLGLAGFSVEAYQNPLTAIEAMRDHGNRFVLALVDFMMPEMDGITCVRHLKAICPELPCIMITAYESPPLDLQSIRDEVLCVISKPWTSEQLLASINVAIEPKDEMAPRK